MRATSIGHAGILVDTVDGSICCDPWFLPQFFGSWFVFPRNDHLPAELMHRICNPDYLYISHIHADHLDEEWLVANMNKDTKVLIPGYPTRELERIMRRLGFNNIIRTVDREEMALGPNLRITIHCEISITDGPGGDSALVISDGTARLVNQNDCRTSHLETLSAHGPADLHWIQYSGAIWYPMVYEETPERMRELVDAKVESQFARAMRYVEAIDARAVVPSAGPPAFLDPDLFGVNVITGDELSIFPDQRSFMARLAAANRQGILAIPGTAIEFGSTGPIAVVHPVPQAEVDAIFADKEAYLRQYQADWMPWLQQMRAGWHAATPDLLPTLQAWWEPLMLMAPTLCDAIGDVCVLHAGDLAVANQVNGVYVLGFLARFLEQTGDSTSPTGRCASGTARPTRSASTSSASWWKRWSRNGPTTGATRCSSPAGSPPGEPARSTSTCTTSSSRCRSNACAAPRPKPCASTTPTVRRWPLRSSSSTAGSSSARARIAKPT